jgi:hypothetical protein
MQSWERGAIERLQENLYKYFDVPLFYFKNILENIF